MSQSLPPPEADRAYTVKEAAGRVGVCDDTLYNEARNGKLTLRKIRRRTVITATDLAAYLKSLPTFA